MELEIQSAKLVLSIVDKETGEIITREATLGDFKEVKKSSSSSGTRTRKPKDDGDPNPKATLLEGKIQLNNAAMELTGWEAEMKIDIRFEKKGKQITPIMLEDMAKGNRLTKTNTISCRGSKHDNLSEYGTVFDVVPYEGKDGWFKLVGDAPQKEDDTVEIPDEISDPEEDEVDVDADGVEAADIDFNLDID
jgi:hypothetical protein